MIRYMDRMYLVRLKHTSILDQLRLEEALLRADDKNYCLFNDGTEPAIVLGISSKIDQLIHLKQAKQQKLSMIRRFSGGGTVVVDQNTLFVTTILNKKSCSFEPFPKPILEFGCTLYLPYFSLKDHDYVIEDRKYGGNALCITKERLLHHTSWLWDYDVEKMSVLKIPDKAPEYRKGRSHQEFISCLSHLFPSKETLFSKVKERLEKSFCVEEVSLGTLLPALKKPHRKSTQVIS